MDAVFCKDCVFFGLTDNWDGAGADAPSGYVCIREVKTQLDLILGGIKMVGFLDAEKERGVLGHCGFEGGAFRAIKR